MMKATNRMVDRSMFVFVWLTILTISTALVAVFVVGFKTIFGI